MKKITTILLLTLLFLSSCGKSKEEIELEKAKVELEMAKLKLSPDQGNSLAKPENNYKGEEKRIAIAKARQEMARKLEVHKQRANVGKQKRLNNFTDQIQQYARAIPIKENEILEISQFEWGRASSTKDKQLKKANSELALIKSYYGNLKNEIAQLEYQKTFDFQKTPEGVVKYIFSSAAKQEYSNLRYLADPYAENDGSVTNICYGGVLSYDMGQLLSEEFGKGRIMGKPKYEGNKAAVEIAIGPTNRTLETMNLVKRNGLWYLSSI